MSSKAERDFLANLDDEDPDVDVDFDELENLDVPPVVGCPCGSGYAERKKTSRTEPNQKNKNQQTTTYFYKHEGCPIGGEIVTVDGEVERARGPLFNPKRWNALTTREHVAAPASTVMTDGGSGD